jgi:predicted transposase YdaD
VRERTSVSDVPSISHEGLVALFRNRPELAPALLRDSLHVDLPPYAEVRIEDSDLTQLQPTQFTADLVLLLSHGSPVLVIVVEAQLSEDRDKQYSWPLYLAATRARYRCPAIVLVVAPTEAIARWAATPVALGAGYPWAPTVLGPALVPVVTEPEQAVRDPELAVLSVLAHGNDETTGVSVALAALAAARGLEDHRAGLYHDLVLATLGDAARTALEQLMATGYEFQTDFAKKHQAIGRAEGETKGRAEGRAEGETKGRAEGEARGKAEGVLRVLEVRGVATSEAERARILATTDLALLDQWLVRAVTAKDAAEIFEK